MGEPKPNQIKPNGNVMEYVPVDIRLEKARANEKYWHEEIGKIHEKQMELTRYDFYTETVLEKVNMIERYESKFKNILDEPIIIDPEKLTNEMISFKGASGAADEQLVYETGVGALGADLLRYYAKSTNPLRKFEISGKTETTLRDLFTNFRMFLETQLTIPKPTQKEIDANQEEVDHVWAEYRKAQEEVKKLQ